jgi:hypothetical protein
MSGQSANTSGGTTAVAFALTPAAAIKGVLDFSDPNNIKLYKQAVMKLHTTLFDVEASTLNSFLASLSDRANTFDWDHILNIPIDINSTVTPKPTKSLLTEYGQITLKQVVDHVETYSGQQGRQAQDSKMLYECIMASLSVKGRNKINVFRKDYTVDNQVSGTALLKVIIRESHIDTRGSVRHIRANLSSLPTYLATVNYDIIKFNQYVREQLDALNARGETTQDLLANLFQTYKTCKDKDFVMYIKGKEDEYDDGEDIDEFQLMARAQNKYKVMVESKSWAAPSKEEEKIVALEAEIKKLSNSKQSTKKKTDKKGKGKGKGKGENKDDKSNKGKYNPPAWKLKPPKPNEKNNKEVEGRTYWWCPNHKMWTLHKPSECNGVKPKRDNKKNDNPESNSDNENNDQNNRKLRLKNALQTIIEDQEE